MRMIPLTLAGVLLAGTAFGQTQPVQPTDTSPTATDTVTAVPLDGVNQADSAAPAAEPVSDSAGAAPAGGVTTAAEPATDAQPTPAASNIDGATTPPDAPAADTAASSAAQASAPASSASASSADVPAPADMATQPAPADPASTTAAPAQVEGGATVGNDVPADTVATSATPGENKGGSVDSTSPADAGTTGFTGGTGGSFIGGTNPAGALPESKSWQPPTARGLDLMGAADPVPKP